MPNKIIGRKSTKLSLRLVCVGHLCWAWDLYLSVVYIPSEIPLEKMDFSFAISYQLKTASWLGMRAHVYFLSYPPSAETLCILPWFLSYYISQSCSVYKTLSPWCHLFPLTLTIFLPPLPNNCPGSEEKGLVKTPILGLSVLKSITLYTVQLWVSLIVTLYWKWKLLG